MKNIFTKQLLLFITILCSFYGTYAATIFSTTVGGNWSASTTWVGGVLPAAGDNVVIADGATVTIDTSPGVTLNSITVGQGVSGVLQYPPGTTVSAIVMSGNLIINTGGVFSTSSTNPASATTHTLSIGGNITNNGTLDAQTNTNSRLAITVTGSSNFTNTGATLTRLFTLILNASGATLDFNPTTALTLPATGFLTVTAGMFKLDGTLAISNPIFSTATYIISATAGFWLNNPNAVVTGLTGSTGAMGGILRITSGVYNIGTGVNNSMTWSNGAIVIIEGGVVNVQGKFGVSAATNVVSYTQSAGAITVGIAGGSNLAALASFDAGSATGTSFTMSGGSIILAKAGANTEYRGAIAGAITNITGGTLQVGNSVTAASAVFKIAGATPNLTLDNSSAQNPGITQSAAVGVWGDMVLNGSGAYTQAAFPLTMRGCSAANPGNITISGTNAITLTTSVTVANALTFSSSLGNQTFSLGSGSLAGNAFGSLTINNTFPGGTVTLPTGKYLASTGTLSLTAGICKLGPTGTGMMTLGNFGVGGYTIIRTQGSMLASYTSSCNCGGIISYIYNGSGTMTTGPEVGTFSTSTYVDSLTVSNSALVLTLGLTFVVKKGLVLNGGIIKTTTSNVLTLGMSGSYATVTGGSANSYVNGPLVRRFPYGQVATGTFDATTFLPVGTDNTYLPIYFDMTVTGFTSNDLNLQVQGFDTNTGTNISPSGASLGNHRWQAFGVGASDMIGNGNYIKIVDAEITSTNNIMNATSGAGVYSSVVPQTTKATDVVYTNSPGLTASEFTSRQHFSYGDGCNPLLGNDNLCTGVGSVLFASAGNNVATTGTWSSSVPGVASVNSSGNVTSFTNGTTTITFKGNNPADACNGLTVARVIRVVPCSGAPGGVSSGLFTYLKADAGVTGTAPVTAWSNSWTGNAVTVNGQPTLTYLPKQYNYNPVINFSAPTSPRQYLSMPTYNGATGINYASIFTAAHLTDLTRVNSVIATTYGSSMDVSVGNKPPNGTLFGGSVGGVATLQMTQADPDFAGTNIWRQNGKWVTNDAPHLATPNIISAVSYTGTSTVSCFFGGLTQGSSNYDLRDWRGPVAELIGYTSPPSLADRIKIESYLALKYGITMDNSAGGTSGDYVLSNGSTVWQGALNPSFQRQVIGVVKDNSSGLTQKQSHSDDDSLRVFVGNLAANNQANTTTITTDLSSLVVGNNGGRLRGDGTLSKPPTIFARMGRVWKVTNSGFTDNFALEIKWDSTGPFTISDIRLLVSDDPNDFSNAQVYDSYSVNFYIGSIIVKDISNSIIPKNSTKYITIGTTTILTPLRANNLQFTANAVANKQIELNWQTDAEDHPDYFTIERSVDGNNWQALTTVKASAITSNTKSYTALDPSPYTGISYYRVKQLDRDGSSQYSVNRSITITNAITDNTVLLYPNPVGNQLYIKAKANELKAQHIITITGQDVSSMIKVANKDSNTVVLDLSKLSAGIYQIKTSSGVHKIVKQ